MMNSDKILSTVLEMEETVLWLQDTLRSQLKFGLDEAQAVYRRENRAKGVCITLLQNIDEIKKNLP